MPVTTRAGIKITLPGMPNVIVPDITDLSREEWLSARRSVNDGFTLGGSDAAAVEGISPYVTPLELYRTLRNEPVKEREMNEEALALGHFYEHEIAEKFCAHEGYQLVETHEMYQHRLCPWMIADFDFLIVNKKTGKISGLEIKHTDAMNFSWQQDMRNGVVRPYYEQQVRHYMAIAGLSEWVLCLGWSAGNVSTEITNIEHTVIVRDEYAEEAMIERQRQFIEDCKEGRIPSLEDVAAKQAFEALNRSYGMTDAETEFDPSVKPLIQKLQRAREEKEKLEKQYKLSEEVLFRAKADLLEIMKGATSGILYDDEGDIYTVRQTTRNKYGLDEETLSTEHPTEYGDSKTFDSAFFKKTYPALAKEYKTHEIVPSDLVVDHQGGDAG